MNEAILEEIQRDVFDRPKSTLDLDYLNNLKAQIKVQADEASFKLKRNVFENYSLFIESSREISHLKDEMRTLNNLLERQQDSLNKLLDQLNKNTLIHQQNIDRPKAGRPTFDMIGDVPDDMREEIEPEWVRKLPEDLDIIIAQHEFGEGVELSKKVKEHIRNYPTMKADLKFKIESKMDELVCSICSELQGSSKSAVISIRLMRELDLSSKAVKIYLNKHSAHLRERSVLNKDKIEPTIQSLKKVSSIFFNILIETFNEFKRAFDLPQSYSTKSCDILGGELPSAPYSALKFWMILEIENLIRLFKETKLPSSTMAEAKSIIKQRCAELSDECNEDFNFIVK